MAVGVGQWIGSVICEICGYISPRYQGEGSLSEAGSGSHLIARCDFKPSVPSEGGLA
jgi:hypothetical protein